MPIFDAVLCCYTLQNPFCGYILVLVPILQLPILAIVLCMAVQISGNWFMWMAVVCFMGVVLTPLIAASKSTGPHSSPLHYKVEKSGASEKAMPTASVQGRILLRIAEDGINMELIN